MTGTKEIAAVPRLRFKGCEEEWTKERLSMSLHIRRGLTYAPSDRIVDGVRVLRSSNIDVDTFVFQDDDVFVRKSAVNIPFAQNGQILITAANGSTNLVGKHAVVQGVGRSDAVAGGFMLLGETETPNYVNAWMSAPWYRRFRSEFVMGGNGALGNLNKSGFDLFEAWTTQEIKEKALIGKSFDALDGLIQFQKRHLSSLRQLKRAMLVKMFPRPGQCIPEIRFRGFEGKWEELRVRDVAERVTRKNLNQESDLPLTISAEHGLIDQGEVFNNRIAAKDVSNYYLVVNGEFAYNRSTSDGAPFGAVKRLDRYAQGVLSTLYMVFALKAESVDSDYLVQYYATDLWHRDIALRAAEGARNHGLLNISVEDFFDTRIVVPPSLPEQRKIAAFFRNLDRLIRAAEKKVAKLRQVKASLLERMFV